MTQPIVFWGGTGQAKVLRECVGHLGYRLVAVFDNDPRVASPFPDVPMYHGVEGFARWREQGRPAEPVACLVAIGGDRGEARVEIQHFLQSRGVEPVTAVHPTAFVAAGASLGKGSQILANSAVCVDARLGEACIVNTAASVDHDCRLGDGVHVAPGAHLAGDVVIGDFCLIGTGASVLPGIRIGDNARVGAGAVVTADLQPGCVACGCPARPVQRR